MSRKSSNGWPGLPKNGRKVQELGPAPPRPVEAAGHARHLVLLFVIAFVALATLVGMMMLHP